MKTIHFYLLWSIFALTLNPQNTYAATMTQSEAHMSIPQNNQLVNRWYNFDKNPYYKELYNNVLNQERAYNNSHYVFYNAFSNEWRVPQDLYLKLYQKLHPLTIDIKDFRAFRWIPVSHQTPKEFLKKEIEEHGLVNDNEWRVKANLLSTNLALFGNVGFTGECTFEYFLNAKSNTKISEDIFKSILDIFDNPASYKSEQTPILYKYLPEIMKLEEHLVARKIQSSGKEPQTLSQIFIPRSIVNQVAYVAWVQGNPYDEKLVNWVSQELFTRPGKHPTFEKSQHLLQEIRALFKNKPQEHPLFQKILDGIESGKYVISTILDEYKATPLIVPGLNHLQARLIISPEYLGNPSMDVKVFTYDRIPDDKKQAYKKALDDIVEKIFKDVLARARSLTDRMPISTSDQSNSFATKQNTLNIQKTIDNHIEESEKNISTFKNSANQNDTFIAAVLAKQTSQAIQLIQSIPNAHLITLPQSNLPLAFAAIKNKNFSIMSALIANGLDINSSYNVNDTVITLLDYATMHASNSIVQMLINSGAAVTPQTKNIAQVLTRKTILQILP